MLKRFSPSQIRLFLLGCLLGAGCFLAGFWMDEEEDKSHVSLVLEPYSTQVDSATIFAKQDAGILDPYRFFQPQNIDKPWLVWHWPGTEVRLPQVLMELRRFADAGFGGVEIHCSGKGIHPIHRKGAFRDPAWIYLLKEANDYAATIGLEIDWTLGPGIPGEYSVGQKMLTWGEIYLLGGDSITCRIPAPEMPIGHHFASSLNRAERQDDQWLHWIPDSSNLLGCWAAKVLHDGRSKAFWETNDQIILDPDSTWNVTSYLKGDTLTNWPAGPGYWKLIAVYETPSGATPFHPTATFAENIGDLLSPYDFQEGLRVHPQFEAIPYDSNGLQHVRYLLQAPSVDRLLPESFDQFLSGFSNNQIADFLPLLLCEPLRDHGGAYENHISSRPPFVLTNRDQVFRDAYEKWMVEEPFRLGLIGLRKMIHQTGSSLRVAVDDWPFGWEQICQEVDQPAFHQRVAGGNRLAASLIAGCGHIWGNKHSAAYIGSGPDMAYMNTPATLKQQVDLAYLAGADHVIVESEAYQISDREIAWHPGTSRFLKGVNRGGQMGEDDPMAQWWPGLWSYTARTSYLHKLGKKQTDVFVLYPFSRFPAELDISGWEMIPAQPGDAASGLSTLTSTMLEQREDSLSEWLRQISPYLLSVEQAGLSWQWVTEAMIEKIASSQEITASDFPEGSLTILIPEGGRLSLRSTRQMADLQERGRINALLLGESDPQVKTIERPDSSQKLLSRILEPFRPQFPLSNGEELIARLSGENLYSSFRYLTPAVSVRKTVRTLDDGSSLVYLLNTSDQEEEVLILAGEKTGWELDPYSGKASSVIPDEDGILRVSFSSYEARYLWLGESLTWPDSLQSDPPVRLPSFAAYQAGIRLTPLDEWDWAYSDPDGLAPEVRSEKRQLSSWTELDELYDFHGEIAYSTDVYLESVDQSVLYLLDLGKVLDVVELEVNTKTCKLRPWPPYMASLNEYLQPGLNTIQVWVKNTRRNEMVSRSNQGDPSVDWLQATQADLQPAGLLGPVRLWKLEQQSGI